MWNGNEYVSSYRFEIADNPQMSDPVAAHPSSIVSSLGAGQWCRDVVQVDTEGNKSAPSPVQNFMAVDKEVQFSTIFPPEGYKIANTRIPDIRFAWKNNLEDEITFQISGFRSFNTVVHEAKSTSDTVGGFSPRLAAGTWYWRIQSGDGSTGIVTDPRSFQVVPQPAKAGIVSPVGGPTAISRPGVNVKLQWTPVKGADYHQVLLYNGYGQEPIAQGLFSGDTEMDVLFDNHSDGTYRWTTQAFAEETTMSTHVTGLLSEFFFALKKIYPVTPQNPAPGFKYNGLDAYLRPDTLSFSSRSAVEGYEIIITNGDFRANMPKEYGEVETIHQQGVVYRGTSRKLPPLTAGTYRWTVNAITEGAMTSATLPPDTSS